MAWRLAQTIGVLLTLTLSAVATPTQSGRASYYDKPQRVACRGMGPFNPELMTAAHLKVHEWGCGTLALVTNTRNGKSVVVVLTDHGPAAWTGNIIDLSKAAFRAIEDPKRGLAPVTVEILGK